MPDVQFFFIALLHSVDYYGLSIDQTCHDIWVKQHDGIEFKTT